MNQITHPKHDEQTFLFFFSRLFERAAYYGLRSMLLFYMLYGKLSVSDEDAFEIYSWLIGAVIIAQVLGALLGDLAFGNKNVIVIGGFLQTAGAFVLIIPSITGLYVGLAMVALGSGFYSPNLTAQFGKLYLTKSKLMDSGFTLFYLATSLGAIIGPVLTIYFHEQGLWILGFSAIGYIMLISTILQIIAKKDIDLGEKLTERNSSINSLIIIASILIFGVFWSIFELSNGTISELLSAFREISSPTILPLSAISSIGTSLLVPGSLLAIILWPFIKWSHTLKLFLGFTIGSISLIILFSIPATPSEQHIYHFIYYSLLISIAEIFISPTIKSLLTKYTKPKYLAVIFSLLALPSFMFTILRHIFDNFMNDASISLIVSVFLMSVISTGLGVYKLINKLVYKK